MLIEDAVSALDDIIAKDEVCRSILILAGLSAFTGDPLNVAMAGESSSGKSFLPVEVLKLFPAEVVKKLGYASSASFFHDYSFFSNDRELQIDFNRQIFCFLESPHQKLIERLRPVFSGDDKEIIIKIADRNERKGLSTKTVILIGRPAVIYSSTDFFLDMQEISRFILLSPQTDPIKIQQAIKLTAARSADPTISETIYTKEKFVKLKSHISEAIKLNLTGVKLPCEGMDDLVNFFGLPRSRVLRDVKKIYGIAKSISLLDFENRKFEQGYLIGEKEDIKKAIEIYMSIKEENDLGISPFIHQIFEEFILPFCKENNIEQQSLIDYLQKETSLPDWKIQRQIIPLLVSAGLIIRKKEGRKTFLTAIERKCKKIIVQSKDKIDINPKVNYCENSMRVNENINNLAIPDSSFHSNCLLPDSSSNTVPDTQLHNNEAEKEILKKIAEEEKHFYEEGYCRWLKRQGYFLYQIRILQDKLNNSRELAFLKEYLQLLEKAYREYRKR